LGQAQVAVDVTEQGGGRAEAVPVRDRGSLTGLPVLARNAECAVTLLGERGPALGVRGFQCRRGQYIIPPLPRGTPHPPPRGGALFAPRPRAPPHATGPPP